MLSGDGVSGGHAEKLPILTYFRNHRQYIVQDEKLDLTAFPCFSQINIRCCRIEKIHREEAVTFDTVLTSTALCFGSGLFSRCVVSLDMRQMQRARV